MDELFKQGCLHDGTDRIPGEEYLLEMQDLASLPEPLLQDPVTVFEDLTHPAVNKQPTGDAADKRFSNVVIEPVGHQHPSGNLPEMMLVVP